jgi:hypothetical protein
MLLSNTADVPPGPATVLILFTLFVAAFLARQHSDRRRARSRPVDDYSAAPLTPGSTSTP